MLTSAMAYSTPIDSDEYFSTAHIYGGNVKIRLSDNCCYFAHCSILCNASNVLSDQLSSDMGIEKQLDFSCYKKSAVLLILEFIYPQFNASITIENVTDLLWFCHTYRFCTLHSHCTNIIERYLKTAYITVNVHELTEESGKCIVESSDGIAQPIRTSPLKNIFTWLKHFTYIKNEILVEQIYRILADVSMVEIKSLPHFELLSNQIKLHLCKTKVVVLEEYTDSFGFYRTFRKGAYVNPYGRCDPETNNNRNDVIVEYDNSIS
ncbi:hypothetical protein GJ496_004317 [Pomphorhynchus laevis]|nr:hypothetical protein GJ496_004317 [Pomphorhynchus laevis]